MPVQAQQSLFDLPTFNINRPVKEALRASIEKSGLSREEVVNRMNRLAQRFGVVLSNGKSNCLTGDAFEKWLSLDDALHNMPVRAIPIFCKAVNDPSVLEEIINPLGYQIIGDDDRKLLAWAKAYQQARRAKQTMKKLEAHIE